MNGCLEEQSSGKSRVGLSVHLPLRHTPPAFGSTGDYRHCAEGAEVSKITETQKIPGKLGIGGGDRGAESTALHMRSMAQLRGSSCSLNPAADHSLHL